MEKRKLSIAKCDIEKSRDYFSVFRGDGCDGRFARWWIVIFLVIFLAMPPFLFSVYRGLNRSRCAVKNKREQQTKYIDTARKKVAQLGALKKTEDALRECNEKANRNQREKALVLSLFKDISCTIPSNTWLERVEIKNEKTQELDICSDKKLFRTASDKKVEITGFSLDEIEIAAFAKALSMLKGVSRCAIVQLQKESFPEQNSAEIGRDFFSFKIEASIPR